MKTALVIKWMLSLVTICFVSSIDDVTSSIDDIIKNDLQWREDIQISNLRVNS